MATRHLVLEFPETRQLPVRNELADVHRGLSAMSLVSRFWGIYPAYVHHEDQPCFRQLMLID